MRLPSLLLLGIFVACSYAQAEPVHLNGRIFNIPTGFELKLAAHPELTQRPIVVDFDNNGHLFVAESSGTNDNVQQQLEDKPHSILRLSDTDNDGVFDRRTVFADRMMFPEGVLCHDGSVYVAAPPQIWKLTDSDDDGIADKREIWFDAKTLTGCANDLHGPYLGPDGWIYWCKGAFAEQTYERPEDNPLVTRAAHIFRRRPEGGIVEAVMTGGMDNPVEVAFSPEGERFFTTTFFQHPANGQRDGLIHAIYGGVYGKQHGVIEGHPRTGDLMPVLTHLGAAAPSGIARLKSNRLGFANQLLAACFNLHSVTRHELVPEGASFRTIDSELVSTNDLDFHPTDVIEDADGSVLVVDTGGWYKLCCPTSQLHKPDITGGIYRLTNKQEKHVHDPRGKLIDWDDQTPAQLTTLLSDDRFAVRHRAIQQLAQLADAALPALQQVLAENSSPQARRNAIWTACRISGPTARSLVRTGLSDRDTSVRHAASHAASVWRDRLSGEALTNLLVDDSPAVRRVAAEAIGRIKLSTAVPEILALLQSDIDRVLEHSLIYALIEINSPEPLLLSLGNSNARLQRRALLALRQLPNAQLSADQICELLTSTYPEVQAQAAEIAVANPQYAAAYARIIRKEFESPSLDQQQLVRLMARLSSAPDVAELVADILGSDRSNAAAKASLVDALSDYRNATTNIAVDELLGSNNAELVAAAIRHLNRRDASELAEDHRLKLKSVAGTESLAAETRLLAAEKLQYVDDRLFGELIALLGSDNPARTRSLAATAIASWKLSPAQLAQLAESISEIGPLELSRILNLFEQATEASIGVQLFQSLAKSPAAASLPTERLLKIASRFGNETMKIAEPLLAKASVDAAKQAQQLEEMLATLPAGDVRRGQKLFHDEKLACFACHAVGYRGGNVGPDLSRIGRSRARRDLLESIMYPSASFVRSYEPLQVLTNDGRQLVGTIRDETSEHLVLQINATEQRTIPLEDIEVQLPGKVSIMPAGMDKLLTPDELADLLAFLESRK